MRTLETASHSENSISSKSENSTLRKVPTLSLASYTKGTAEEKTKFIDNLFTGLKEYGFIILKDHNVKAADLHKAYELLANFYALPTEVKKSYISPKAGFQRGYTPFGQEHAKDSPVMDLKEFWHVGRDLPEGHALKEVYPANVWPSEIPEFKTHFLSLFNALEEAGSVMLEALTMPLELDKDFFARMTKDGNSILRLLHYPPIPEGVDPRCVRAAAHEDINFITILPAATTSGLQLKDRDGTWLDIDSEPDTLIVDVGDMLARLTNDVLPSTTHRVINPQDGKNSSRYSMPFFMHPHPEAMLSCLPSCKGTGAKYADITGHDFLMQRLREIGLIK
ncbi:isopenicillin N synthase family dioxygenase [Bdellovibrio svalbardensis]|uniref:2-oxoglutarate-dependent ethylene/succinate-forming enzyme n=1 Tax=Bdellovibrio svalbardensis TaxID=2972972 RepID=A0ABT6DJP3_9BACT|nr:2-oxoglutarate and iron-dependent oxygenase domain-containing protein [Bdellovibrio svalbardensis]MDG0817088.1 isopenicillin N synthase family oxygenase [Bdellovibrio svalbardensis]